MKNKRDFFEQILVESSKNNLRETGIEANALQTVGRLFRLFRKDHNLTQTELAKRFHCSPTYISGLERGNPGANLEQTLRLSHHIHFDFGLMLSCACRVAYLLSDEPDASASAQDGELPFDLLNYIGNACWMSEDTYPDATKLTDSELHPDNHPFR